LVQDRSVSARRYAVLAEDEERQHDHTAFASAFCTCRA